ncbi:MAG: TonB-dependent receptor domain-containing protein [Alistipes shahii]
MMGVSWYQSARLFSGQPADRRRGLLPLRRRGVEQIRRGRPQGRALRHRRQVAGRGGRLRRFPAGHRGWLTFDAGLRVDHHSHIGTEWIPQAGLSFHLPHTIELKASAVERFPLPHHPRDSICSAPQNPDLRPERLWSYELSLLAAAARRDGSPTASTSSTSTAKT